VIRVVKPGMLSTIQDRGRWGYQTFGVSVSGPMDMLSHGLANRLLGNAEDAATIEVTLLGPELDFGSDATIVVTGAQFELRLDDREIDPLVTHRITAGARLRFGPRRRGARAYLGVAGGIQVPTVLGSRATHLVSGMGGLDGRALRPGDVLPISPTPPGDVRRVPRVPLPQGAARVRVVPGPDAERFTAAAMTALTGTRYAITPESDRMGYRLKGQALERCAASEIISGATAIGSLQVPASGQPILLMADRQTAGGYPRIATVITADLPAAGQLAPGDTIEFQLCDQAEAVEALRRQQAWLNAT
jgi:antagonist of KipI